MDLFDLFVKIKADDSEAQETVGGLAGKMQGALGTAAKVGAAAIGAATAAVVGFGVSSIKTGGEFDKAMAQVAATSGKTVEEISDLREFAQQMGATTQFSATQSAEALNFMALAGYSAAQSMTMLPTVLDLAAAGGMELAQASDMVTDAQTALGLNTEQTTQMVDQMALTASKTNTSVSQLGEAFLTIGGTAKELKGGTQELSKVLGVLADNGIKGSEAGTHLRNIMLAMNPTTKDAKEAFEQLNFSAYDATGSLRSMDDIFLELQEKTKDMTSQQRTDILGKMFNKTDLASINALLDTQGARWDELTREIGNYDGAASEMAKTQMDNLAGDMTYFQSAMEGFQIAISDAFTPMLREFVQFGTDSISSITEGFRSGNMDAVFEGVGSLISELVVKITTMLPKMVESGIKILGAVMSGIIQAAPQLGSAAIQIVSVLVTSIASGLSELFSSGEGTIGSFIDGITEKLPLVLDTGINAVRKFLDAVTQRLPEILDKGVEIVTNIVNGLLQNLPTLITAAGTLMTEFLSFILSVMPQVLEKGVQLVLNIVKGVINSLPQIVNAARQVVTSFLNLIRDKYPEFLSKGVELIGKIIAGIIQMIPDVIKSAGDVAKNIMDTITNTNWLDIGINVVKGIANGIKNGISWVIDAASDVVDSIWDTITGKDGLDEHSPSKKMHQAGVFAALGLSEGMDSELDTISDSAMRMANAAMVSGIPVSTFGASPEMEGVGGSGRSMSITQNIYSKAMTASELMREARYEQERAVLAGV